MPQKIIEEFAQKIVDCFFKTGSRVSQLHYEFVVEKLEKALSQQKEEIKKRVGGMKRKGNPELETNQDFGYNQAVQDILKTLDEV